MCVCMYVCMYVYMHVCMCVCMCVVGSDKISRQDTDHKSRIERRWQEKQAIGALDSLPDALRRMEGKAGLTEYARPILRSEQARKQIEWRQAKRSRVLRGIGINYWDACI